MSEYSAYVGLDVHKDTISVAIAFPGREQPVFRGVIGNRHSSLRRLIRNLTREARCSVSVTRPAHAATACIVRSSRRVTTAWLWRRAWFRAVPGSG